MARNLKKKLAMKAAMTEDAPASSASKPDVAETDKKMDELERRIQEMSVDSNKNNVDALTSDLNKLEVKEEDETESQDDLIARGPQRFQRDHVISAPYEKKSQHLSGGQLIETTGYTSGLFTNIFNIQDISTCTPILLPPQHQLPAPPPSYAAYLQEQVLQQPVAIPEIQASPIGCLATASNSMCGGNNDDSLFDVIESFSEQITPTTDETASFTQDDLDLLEQIALKGLGIDSSGDETDYCPTPSPPVQTGMNIPCSFEQSPYGESSGYESATSTPSTSPGPNNTSNSPPNSYLDHNNFNIPTTIQEIEHSVVVQQKPTKTTHYVSILPKPDPKMVTQEKFLKFLRTKENEQFLKRYFVVVNKIVLEQFSQPDGDGDTALMKLAANRDALDLNILPKHLTRDPQAMRFAFAYGIIERLERELPSALQIENMSNQSALYLAATNVPECPMFAAYIAETMLRHGFTISKPCYVPGCIEGGTLLHCVAARGDEYVGVLKELLNIPGGFVIDAKDNSDMTPLQVAINAYCNSCQSTDPSRLPQIKIHKTVETLIKFGASLSVRFKPYNSTPLLMALDMAAKYGPYMDLLEVLLKAAPGISNEVNTPDNRNIRPLFAAAKINVSPVNSVHSVGEMMKMLIKYGAPVKQDIFKFVKNPINNFLAFKLLLKKIVKGKL
ncbi:hypothetical protein B566_EDAN015249 [Ephemera danica]|nr:hypothetical protein B566_EDAN015249 [Ephemera danica]